MTFLRQGASFDDILQSLKLLILVSSWMVAPVLLKGERSEDELYQVQKDVFLENTSFLAFEVLIL
jgi:hypothetical protein